MITIFTPTYNRKLILPVLYDSLVAQTNQDFIWLIVDDGSSDGTDHLVNIWRQECRIKIQYYFMRNGGKHRAHNCGVLHCITPWFICVDSDDFLEKDAVETFQRELTGIPSSYIGVMFPKCDINNGLPKVWFDKNYNMVNVSDLRLVLNQTIETALLIKTQYLKKNLFPEYEGENYIGEDIVYDRLQETGGFKPVYKAVYYYEYRNDGLTRNIFRLWKNNPAGTLSMLNSRYHIIHKAKVGARRKILLLIKCIMNINALCMTSEKKIVSETPNVVLSYLMYIPSIVFKWIRYN